MVHNLDYIDDAQRCIYIMQQLSGFAKRAVECFASDRRGYVLSLKRLQFRFVQMSKIAQAGLQVVTQGKVIDNNNISSLEEFFYQMSDCLVTLRMLWYNSDLYSSDVLPQVVRKLPSSLFSKMGRVLSWNLKQIRRTNLSPFS